MGGRLLPYVLGVCIAAVAGATRSQSAPDYPARPVRYIVPYAPGGPTDTVGRLIAAELTKRWSQQVVVENRPGANANIGAELAAKAPPDGYTLFQGTGSTHGSNPALYPKLPYDPVRDFAPIVPLTESTLYLAVSPSTPVSSVAELIALARAHPGKLNYGSLGPGSAHQLAGELLKLRAGVAIVGIPFKGSAPAMTALLAGEIDVIFDSTALPHAKAGRIKILAVTTRHRWPPSPEIPTMIEAGVPDFESRGWFGLFAPSGTPEAVIQKINRDVNDVLGQADVRRRLTELGAVVTGGTAQAFAESIQRELTFWAAVVKAAGLKVE
jgi:tripartite-type tricarboxylate transporter receptor subunit TctC